MTKLEQKKIDRRIEKIYGDRCNGVQIPMMEIPKIFKIAYTAISDGADDLKVGDVIEAYVRSIIMN